MIGLAESRLKGVPSGPDPDALILQLTIPSNNYSFILPMFNTTGYNCIVNWKDGKTDSTITSYIDGDRIHTYDIAGIYEIEITGVFKGFYFNSSIFRLIPTRIIQWGNTGMTSLTNAFNGCINLIGEVPELPNSVSIIGNYAFEGCTGLTGALTIPSSVTGIGTRSFKGCTGLTGALTIPSSVTSIGTYSFYGCTGLTGTLTIPSSVTSIGVEAFEACTRIVGVIIESGITIINSGIFYLCSGLTSVTIPSSVTRIYDSAFQSCTALTSITIPSSVTRIDDYAFYGSNNASLVVWMNSSTPPTLGGSSVFDATNVAMRIKVPAAAVAAYKAATYWSEYAAKIVSQ